MEFMPRLNASTGPVEDTGDNGGLATQTRTGMDEQIAVQDSGVGYKQTASEQYSTPGAKVTAERRSWRVAGHLRDNLSGEMKHET